MAIKYGIYKTPVPGDREDNYDFHARFISNARTDMDRLSKLVSARTKYNTGDIRAILDAFVFVFQVDLAYGYIVELEGIGTFSPSLSSRIRVNEKGEKKLDVKVKTINYRCCKSLKKSLEFAQFQEIKPLRKSRLTVEQRKYRILGKVNKSRYITTQSVIELNHCSKKVALADLKELIKENKLITVGAGKNTLYILPYPDSNI